MIGLIILAAFISTIGTYIDKLLVKKGITKGDYFYYMCLTMVPFSIIMIIVEITTRNVQIWTKLDINNLINNSNVYKI